MNLQIIAENFCSQLLALQQHIATRDENPNLPTIHEVNTQVRLINSIDRTLKMITRLEKAAAQAAETTQPIPAKVTAEVPLPATPTPPPATSDVQPFPDSVFEENRALLIDYRYGTIDTVIVIRNREVHMWWFIYNLYQYCQPADKRHYIATNDAFRQTINISQLHQEIASYLNQVMAA